MALSPMQVPMWLASEPALLNTPKGRFCYRYHRVFRFRSRWTRTGRGVEEEKGVCVSGCSEGGTAHGFRIAINPRG